MNNTSLLSDFELDVAAAMAVPDADPQFVDTLKKRLMGEAKNLASSSTQSTASSPGRFRLAWGIPLILFALLTLTTLLVGPRNVWAAVQRMFGYMPGVGYVQTDGQIWVLDEPVMDEREGIQVLVEQVVADAERTVVIYTVEGLSLQEANSQGEGTATGSMELLRLPDGSELPRTGGGGSGWAIGYRSRLVFSALPDGVNEITLVIPRLQSMPAGVAPENWEIPLRLVVSSGEVTLLPVEEIPQPTAPAEQPAAAESGITFSLARVVELDDGFQFEGTVQWLGSSEISLDYFNTIEITDANGKRIPSEYAQSDELFTENTPTQFSWAQRTVRKSPPGPWTLRLIETNLRAQANIPLQIDLGSAPQVGQTWQVDYPFEVQGVSAILHSITLEQNPNQEYQLVYHFTGDQNLYDVLITDQAMEELSGSYGGMRQDQGFSIFVAYNTLPVGVRQLTIASIGYHPTDVLQITWQPPESAADADPAATPSGETCITPAVWEQITAQPPTVPGEISGKLLLKTHTGQRLPEISLTSIDGAQSQVYEIGAWISLSPDGKTIANPNEDGIHLIDTTTGESTVIPNTLGGEYPVWSPDGSEIAYFVWEDAAIYRIKLDGSDRAKVYEGSDMIYLSGWSSASNQLIYLGFGSQGPAINAINLDDGSIEMLIQTGIGKPNYRPVLSPDGEWLLYKDVVEGDTVNGIYAARLDGSEKHLLVAEDSEFRYVPMGGAWSPDGSWVIINLLGAADGYTNPTPYLINPTTCEVIPLPDLSGEAAGWSQ